MGTSNFLGNAWYAVAWSSEIGRSLFPRSLMNDPILLYRKENWEPVAINGRCAHRFAPLHMGRLIGDTVQCPYHGLQYGESGRCVLNPNGDGMIPPKMAVRKYPVAERHRLIWLWMGEAEKADPSLIPDFSCHTDPSLACVYGVIEMKANYQLITDNLLDLAHAEFVHEGILSSDAITRSKLETIERDGTIYANRWAPNGKVLPAYVPMLECDPNDQVDQWFYMRWDAPAHMLLDTGLTRVGKSRNDGAWVYGTDIITPKDEHNSYYFWAVTRNYKVGDPSADEFWRQVIKGAFEGQDQVIIEAQQRMMNGKGFEELDPVMFASDSSAQRARRRLAEMIQANVTPKPGNANLIEVRARDSSSCSPVLPAL